VEPQEVQAGLITFQGMADVRFRHVQRQSDLRQPGHEEVLAVFEDRAIFMEAQRERRCHPRQWSAETPVVTRGSLGAQMASNL
jgi:hypothetical protein